jgi:cob(I)alamin adenosyltransferase
MAIYTRLGDSGDTVTLSGEKVRKDDERIEAQGQLDELNALLGLVISFSREKKTKDVLGKIQKELFILGAELSMEKRTKKITLKHVESLEDQIDEFHKDLPELANFIIPGGCKSASLLHYARTICRRCERRLSPLADPDDIGETTLIYLNRLGDLLFTMARRANRRKRVEEVIWKG